MTAPKILWRSALGEIFLHTALGLAVIGLLLLVQNLLRYMEDLVAVGLGGAELLRLLLFLVASYLSFAIPTALLFGILLTFGRMSADGEVVALRASGIGIAQLLPPVVLAGVMGTALLTGLTFELEPRGRLQLKDLVRELTTSNKLARPGRFRQLGDRTLYVRALGDEACPLQGVFLADFTRGAPLYTSARCGAFRGDGEGADGEGTYLTLELLDGSVHLPDDGSEAHRSLRFARMETHLDLTAYLSPGRRSRNLTFGELLTADAAFRRGEGPELRGHEGARDIRIQIHRRMAFSLSTVLLAILAVPLGVRPVRTGRSWGALVALTLMAGYWLVLSMGELAAEARWVSPGVGLWAADGIIGVLAFVLVRRLRRVEV